MKSTFSSVVLFTIVVLVMSPASGTGQVTVDPLGLAFSVEQGGSLESSLQITNSYEQSVRYLLDQEIVAEPEERDEVARSLRRVSGETGPVRDNRGGPDAATYEWRDNDEVDGPEFEWLTRANFENNQITALQFADDNNVGPFNLAFVFPFYNREFNSIRVCSNGWASFSNQTNQLNFDQGQAGLPGNAIENMIAIVASDWYPPGGGDFWIGTNENFTVIMWDDCHHFTQRDVIWSFQIQLYPDGMIKLMYHPHNFERNVQRWHLVGIQNQDRNVGLTAFHGGADEYMRPENGRAIGFGPASAWETWLQPETEEGVIAGGETIDLPLEIVTEEDIPVGVHELLVTCAIETVPDEDEDPVTLDIVQFTALLSVESPAAELMGAISDSREQTPLEGARADLEGYYFSRFADDDGAYSFIDLPAGVYAVTFSAPNFLPETHEVELGEDDVELNVELLQAECNLSTDLIDEAIAPDTDTHINFSVSNDGNGPLTYTVERRLIGDANAAPWEMRREYPVANLLEDNRIEGVAFDGDNFYFAGANDNDPNTIYVTDRDGNLTDSFVQPGESRYGMKDLEWDGELLWGSGEARIFGFETDGTIRHEFQGPVNPSTSLIAYDPDRDQLWVCGTTSAIFPITKEGEAAGNSLNSKRLRMYGISYWPDDPDGYNLYLLTAPNDTSMYVYKMDPESGDTIRVKDLHPQIGEAPGGVFICNTFDVYSWVMMFTNNIAPANGGDRNFIYQLDARKEWFMVEPVAGVIDAGADQAFDLHLNAAGLPAVTFEGELLFTHDGDGSASILSVRLDVVEGPVQSEREISLTTGWNLVSANLQPDEESIIALTQGLADDDNLLMVKDDEGRFYLPSTGFSNLEGWNVAEGYWMKVRRPAEFLVSGMTVMAEDVIGLHEGWQAVSYYPRREVEATAALSGIEPVLRIAKDGMGNFYLPGHNYSNIGMLRQGQGYQLAVTEAADLVYRLRLDEQVAGLNQARGISVYDRPGRFGVVPPTGRNMSLLVTGIVVDGTDVGVYAGETFVGSGVFALGRAGVAVWGDDPSTQAIEGAGDGAELTLRIRDDLGERSVKALLAVGELVYSTDGLAVVTVSEVVTPREFGLTGAYPNPFNGRLTAGFDLPEAGLVTVGLYDLSGREVLRVVEGRFEAGSHSVAVNGESLPSGVYVLRVEAFGRVSQLKAALIK